MYLLVFEDGTVKRADDISKEDYTSVDDGYLQIIKIAGDVPPQEYYEGEWMKIEEI